MELIRERHGGEIFSEDGSLVDDQVAQMLSGRRIATAESCTGGLVAARLTDRPVRRSTSQAASSPTQRGQDRAARGRPDLIAAHGAVSEPVAEAMADGALNRFGADTAIAITGIAGPGGGTDDKPVGTVCFTVKLADGEVTRTIRLPGDRSDIRERSTTVAMHMLRRALGGRGRPRVRSSDNVPCDPGGLPNDRSRSSEISYPSSPCRPDGTAETSDRTDYYTRSPVRVHVIWQGTDAISGGALYHDDLLIAYTRDVATVMAWLKR